MPRAALYQTSLRRQAYQGVCKHHVIENYQAPPRLDDSLIGNGFKALRVNYPFSIVGFAKPLKPTLAENNNNASTHPTRLQPHRPRGRPRGRKRPGVSELVPIADCP
ncbi:MAG TPA: hypothetical protein DIW86_13280 [Pseudomonas sp.]|nr:hypothetical protein [Pseudomonas sp.]